MAFCSLLYSDHGWQPVWLAFTAFGVALIAARLLCGHLPDKFGGARIALLLVVVQAAGLLHIGLARNGMLASAGAALAGFGYSLVYPGFGVERRSEAVRTRCRRPSRRGQLRSLHNAVHDF